MGRPIIILHNEKRHIIFITTENFTSLRHIFRIDGIIRYNLVIFFVIELRGTISSRLGVASLVYWRRMLNRLLAHILIAYILRRYND